MLVTFISSETGEILMFSEAAKPLLEAIGKETTARGVFTRAEMPAAAAALRKAVEGTAVPPADDELDADGKRKEPMVGLSQRAWPLIDMLERTGRGAPDANIVWQAASNF